MKKYLLVFVVFMSFGLFAQTVLMEEKVDSVYQKTSFGVNGKHFVHMYWSFGFVFGPEQVTKFGNTNLFGMGVRYKYRLTNHLATGLELETRFLNINYPTHGNIKKDKYVIGDFKYAWYFRTNLGMRGNVMGKFIDVGLYGSNNFFTSTYIKVEEDFDDHEVAVYSKEKLKYLESFNYGLLVRVGWGQFVLFSEYRLSDIFKPNVADLYRDIPRWTVGLQIGLHR